MQKFEINNPVALKFIADFKSGVLFEPIITKIKKVKWIIISTLLFIVFIICVIIGKSLFDRRGAPIFTPPTLDTQRVISPTRPASEFDSLRNEIYEFSTDLPDPVYPELKNSINLEQDPFELL